MPPWWRRLLDRLFRPRQPRHAPPTPYPSPPPPAGPVPPPGPEPVQVIAAAPALPAAEVARHLAARGVATAVADAVTLRRRTSSPVVLLLPGTLRPAEGIADVFGALEDLGERQRRRPLLVVWCVRDEDRLEMAAPHATEPGYDPSLPPSGWNASPLFLGTAWRRHLAGAGGNPAPATLVSPYERCSGDDNEAHRCRGRTAGR